jgi:NADH-quinone oxidoreductase subunit J
MLIIIYVGAIAILFLFVVMMLDIHYKKQTLDEKLSYLPFAVFIGIIFSVEIFAALSPFLKALPDHNHYIDKVVEVDLLFPDWWPYNSPGPRTYSYNIHHLRNPGELIWITYLDEVTNIETIGQLLYTYYGIFFLISGIILLIALLGAVSLTMQKREDSYQQQVYRQLSRNYKNAIFNIQSK